MQMQWNILQPDPSVVSHIQKELECGPVVATVLANRGIKNAEDASGFLNPSLEGLPSPEELEGIDRATDRIVSALQKRERILVIGDYDADGVTATAVLVSFLEAAGASVDFHLPHRVHEGYGFHPIHIAQLAAPKKIDLIITVDCGSASHEAVQAAGRFGIDVIVTDHHNIETDAPNALAVINPKNGGRQQSLRELAGVGVAFYLAIALRTALRNHGWWKERPEPNLKSLCDLVAIGTIADIVPLKGVNRILTKAGLEQINTGARPGIRSILAASGIRHSDISSEDIAFRLAPRINAAGRMAHAKLAFDMLTTPDHAMAESLSETLNSLNQKRQGVENQIYEDIVQTLNARPDLLQRSCLFMTGQDWHEGVLGIVAAKLTTHYNRPVILVSTQSGIGKGSGRSIPQLDLFEALSRCADLMEKFGGHQCAAGLTVLPENIGRLKTKFERAVETMLSGQTLKRCIDIDVEIGFEQITPSLVDAISRLEPFGAENPAPVFLARDVHVAKAYTVSGRHRKMMLCQNGGNAATLQAIHFNLSPDAPRPSFFEQIAFRLQWNHYRGNREIQIVMEA